MNKNAHDAVQAEEDSLISRCADGDTEAFAELVKRKRPLAHRLAARICGLEDAEDVSQLVFLKLWREMPCLPTSQRLNRWLVRATVNQAIDTARHVGRRLRLVQQARLEATPDPARQTPQHGELMRIFAEAAGTLGERQRAAFVLREIEGFNTRETADALGVTDSTVRNLVHQARAGLRRALRERFPEYTPEKERMQRS